MVTDPDTLLQTGVAALQRGDAGAARTALAALAGTGRGGAQALLYLAYACELLGDDAGLGEAADRLLALEPRNLYGLLMRGDMLARAGDDRAAAGYWTLALANAPADGAQVAPDLAERLRRAEGGQAAANRRFRAHLDARLAADGVAVPPRLGEAIAIACGERPVYLQQPTSFYYPGLAAQAFFEREAFAWVPALEAAAPAIRAELAAVLADEAALRPYVQAPENRPNRGHALLDDPRWSAFHLWEDGRPVSANAARCPATMAALEAVPMPRIPGRAPSAMFSVLRPGTHIPPHTGMLNTRLICHLPLVVPAGCRLRVGGDVRAVAQDRVMIFDDSIEHEAWNDGAAVRVVLLFEIWRPDLSADERTGLASLFGAIGSYAR